MKRIFPQNVENVKTTNSGLIQKVDGPIHSAMKKPKESPSEFHQIGERLEAVREGFSNLGQTEWAAKHGIGVTTWNNWENGVRRIPVDQAERLCDIYGLTLDFIYRGRRDGLSETASKVI